MPNPYDELRNAQRELRQAQVNFDQADPDYIDIAVHKLQAAELRYGVALKNLRGGERIA